MNFCPRRSFCSVWLPCHVSQRWFYPISWEDKCSWKWDRSCDHPNGLCWCTPFGPGDIWGGSRGRGVISLPVHTLPPCAVSQWLLYGRISFVINELLSAELINPPWLSPNNIHLLLNSCFWLSDFGCNHRLRWKRGKAMDGFSLGCIKRPLALWKPTSVCLVLITLVKGNYYSKIVNLLQTQ